MRHPSSLFVATALLVGACTPPAPEVAPPAAPVPTALETRLVLTDAAVQNIGLRIASAGPQEIKRSLALHGDVRLITGRIAQVPAGVDGIVRVVRKDLGETVKKGEVLALLASRSLAEVKLAYVETEHRLAFAGSALEREKKLFASKATTREALLKAEHAAEDANIDHARALQQLRLLGFGETFLHTLEEDLEKDLSRYRVRSPMDGEIVERSLTMGEAVEVERKLFVIADLSKLWVEMKVPTPYANGLSVGQEITFRSAAGLNEATTKLTFISPMADASTRTVVARAEFDNSDGRWRPGTSGQVGLTGAHLQAAVTVPRSAVHEIDSKPVIFVQVEGATFDVRQVELGADDERSIQITAGIAVGEKVAADNSFMLKAEWQSRTEG